MRGNFTTDALGEGGGKGAYGEGRQDGWASRVTEEGEHLWGKRASSMECRVAEVL